MPENFRQSQANRHLAVGIIILILVVSISAMFPAHAAQYCQTQCWTDAGGNQVCNTHCW